MKTKLPVVVILAFGLMNGISWSAEPPPGHVDLSRGLSSGNEKAALLRTEVRKGKKMNSDEIRRQIQGLRDAFALIQSAYTQVEKQAPGDLKEGHFIALRTHEGRAEQFFKEFEAEYRKPDPNLSTLKKTANEIAFELKFAQNEHNFEMSEIEHQRN